MRDRVVQMAAKMVIEPIFEADFEAKQLSDFVRRRARRRPWKRSAIAGNQGHNFVVDADIQGYFDSIDRKS